MNLFDQHHPSVIGDVVREDPPHLHIALRVSAEKPVVLRRNHALHKEEEGEEDEEWSQGGGNKRNRLNMTMRS